MKQAIVVNEALALPRGKIAVQVAHAAVAASLEAPAQARQRWLQAGMPKVVLAAMSAAELESLEFRCRNAGLPAALIRDAGKTVVPSGTITCVGIGPATDKELQPLISELKLVK